MRPTCQEPNCSKLCKLNNISKKGVKYYSKRCSFHHNKHYKLGKYKYKSYKGDSCILCGFVPKHPCQLDVDHIDGNHKNDEESNLQTLCANCHRLKTYEQSKKIKST